MKIGADISQIVYEGTGVARFTKGLVEAILNYDQKNEWLFFFSSLRQKLDENLKNKILNKGHKLVVWKLPPTFLSFLWNNLHINSKLLTFNFKLLTSLDWFITSDWTEPPLKIKKATIVHDLTYIRYPETVDEKIRKTQEKRMRWVKNESKIIFADSYATKQDLLDFLNIDRERIVINYPGVEIAKPTQAQIKKTLDKYSLKNPFILTVGKIEPRKNLKRLIEAYLKLSSPGLELVIVGQKGWDKTIEQYGNIAIKNSGIRFLGYVNDEELYSFYSSCLFFIYPSLWEGFGYPIVEAMKLGAAVITSNLSSLKEIASDSALLIDPMDVNSIKTSLELMIKDEELRKQLSHKGLKRSKLFGWQNYYNKLIKVLEQ